MLALALSCALAAAPQARSQMQRMVDQLDLSADQKAKVDPILDDEAKQLRAFRGDTSTEATKQKAEIRKATDEKIKPLLTGEQWKKLEQLREERKKQGKKGSKG
jgi:protein CpxP